MKVMCATCPQPRVKCIFWFENSVLTQLVSKLISFFIQLSFKSLIKFSNTNLNNDTLKLFKVSLNIIKVPSAFYKVLLIKKKVIFKNPLKYIKASYQKWVWSNLWVSKHRNRAMHFEKIHLQTGALKKGICNLLWDWFLSPCIRILQTRDGVRIGSGPEKSGFSMKIEVRTFKTKNRTQTGPRNGKKTPNNSLKHRVS